MKSLLLALLLIPAVAWAHPPNTGKNNIHACVSDTGAVRIVGSAKQIVCAVGEYPLHWKIQGPVGPPGSPLPPGEVQQTTSDGGHTCSLNGTVDPDLEVTISSEGGQVIMAYQIVVAPGSAAVRITVLPLLNGQQEFDGGQTMFSVPAEFTRTLSFVRSYPVPLGTHRFGLRYDCDIPSPLPRPSMGKGWLTVWEVR